LVSDGFIGFAVTGVKTAEVVVTPFEDRASEDDLEVLENPESIVAQV
jgi:hypothetical protein